MNPFLRTYCDAREAENMTMSHEAIRQRIADVLVGRFGISEEQLAADCWDVPLTGSVFRFSAVDLTYLFLELEKAFSVRIGREHLDEYGFSTLNNIAEILEKFFVD